jgi:hypothetical protein
MVLCSFEVFAANAQGSSALALATLTAEHDAALGASQRIVIAKPFAGQVNFAYPAGRSGPPLTFGIHRVNLTGRLANELYATIAAAGVSADSAAGSIYEALHRLACTLEPSVTEQNGGGGATRAFTPGR